MIGFGSLESAQRVADAVYWVEQYRPATRRQTRRQPAVLPLTFAFGKTDAAINKGTFASPNSGTVSVWSGGTSFGSMADTGDNITAYNFWGDVANGKQVLCLLTEMGWVIVDAECS